MLKLILIAGGAIAMATAPANAGGKPSPTSQLLKCLGCPGSGATAPQGNGNGGAIVAGNLNTNANASIGRGGASSHVALNLNAAAKLGTKKIAASALAKANANASVNLGKANGDCK